MIKSFTVWKERRKLRAKEREYKLGYDFAAGVLLQSKGCIDPRSDLIFDDKTEFDRGINGAYNDYWQIISAIKKPKPVPSQLEKNCVTAMQDFCRRIENGTVRSTQTYSAFCRILKDVK